MTIIHRPNIPRTEHDRRVSALRSRLADKGVGGVMLMNRADITWLTGFREAIIAPNLALVGVYLPMDGDMRVVAMPGQANYVRESGWGEVVTAEGAEAFVRTLASCAAGADRIGVELSMGLHRSASAADLGLLDALVGADRFVDVSDAIWAARMHKSDWEIAILRQLGKITSDGFSTGLAAVAEGASENEIATITRARFAELGADTGPTAGQIMVRSGRERYPVYCGGPTDRRAQRGEQVMLAGGPALSGYHIDIHRFANIGPVAPLQEALHRRSRAGLDAAIAAIRPGVRTGEIFSAAVLAMQAHGGAEKVQWQVLGHGTGLENYEYPMIEAGGETELSAGMVLCVEVPAYDIPDFRVMGAFLEDCVVVTKTGCDVLTGGIPLDLHVVG